MNNTLNENTIENSSIGHLIEIVWAFDDLQNNKKIHLESMDSAKLKNSFYSWANRFEGLYGDKNWNDGNMVFGNYVNAIYDFVYEMITKEYPEYVVSTNELNSREKINSLDVF